MGVSTNAILFYGYHLPNEIEIPDEANQATGDVIVGWHCSDEAPMPYIYWKSSEVIAFRGSPKELPSTLPYTIGTYQQIIDFAKKYGLPEPGKPVDPNDKWAGEASRIGWWLVSYWG